MLPFRNLKVVQYYIYTPLNYWYDGRRIVHITAGRFLKGKDKGYSNTINCTPKELTHYLRLTRIAKIKSGGDRPILVTKIERLPYRRKRNRFMSNFYDSGIYS